MAHEIFISYSSKDAAPAQAICAALEAAGMRCWIAPRDIVSGSDWGASIVEGIEASKAVVVVFSERANDSPQVVREMESAVSKRIPLIPVRIANAMPTKAMQYFLGVSHWFDAYAQPIEHYLPALVATVRAVLADDSLSWQGFFQRFRTDRRWQLGASAVAVVAVALITASLMRQPAFPGAAAMKSPLQGRWQTALVDRKGTSTACSLDIQQGGAYGFAEDCPFPLVGARGMLTTNAGNAWGVPGFREGTDDGTFYMQTTGGAGPTGAGAYKLESGFLGFGARTLTLGLPAFRGAQWHEVRGRPSDSADDSGAQAIVPAHVEWPSKDVAAMLQRAQTYVRKKWQPDAVPMTVRLKLLGQAGGNTESDVGHIEVSFEFYSPSSRESMYLQPGTQSGSLISVSPSNQDPRQAITGRIVDLRDALRAMPQQAGRPAQVKEATLAWSSGPSCGTGNFAIDNAILPRCPPGPRFAGIQWTVEPAFGNRLFIPATSGNP